MAVVSQNDWETTKVQSVPVVSNPPKLTEQGQFMEVPPTGNTTGTIQTSCVGLHLCFLVTDSTGLHQGLE